MAVLQRLPPFGRIEDERHRAVEQLVDDVRPPLRDLVHHFDGQAFRLQMGRGSAGGDDIEPKLDQLLHGWHDMVLVGILDRYERRSALRQRHSRAE